MQFEMNEMTLRTYLDQRGFRYRASGDELVFEECPYCKTKDKKFSFNRQSTAFQCFKAKCQVKGNLLTFMRDHGDDPLPKKKVYTVPNQDAVKALVPKSSEADRFYRFYAEKTGLSFETLIDYQIGFTRRNGSLYVTFPFIEDGQIVDVKYRNLDQKRDMFTEKDARKTFFGLQYVDIAKGYLHVTEGEKDCMAMRDLGFDNVVSVPMGAKNFTEPMMEFMRKGNFKRVNLFFDADQAGQDGAREFALKVGNWRCRNVILPYKDAQECLQKGVCKEDIEERLEVAKKFDLEDALENDVMLSQEEIRDLYEEDCRKNQYGVTFGIPLLDAITGGLFPGQIMGIIAGPGGFKTITTENLLTMALPSLGDDEWAGFFSMEMSLQREFQRRLQISTGYSRQFLRRGAKDAEGWYAGKVDQLCKSQEKLLVSSRNNLTIPQMVRIIKNTDARTGKRCRLVAVDYLDYIDPEDRKVFNPVGEIMKALNKQLAKPLGVTVIILVQTNRTHLSEGGYGVSLGDGKGGRSIEQELDFYFGLFADKEAKEQRGNFLKHRDFEPDPLTFPGIYPFPYFRLKMDKIKLLDMELITEAELQDEAEEKKEAKKRNKQKKDEDFFGNIGGVKND